MSDDAMHTCFFCFFSVYSFVEVLLFCFVFLCKFGMGIPPWFKTSRFWVPFFWPRVTFSLVEMNVTVPDWPPAACQWKRANREVQ